MKSKKDFTYQRKSGKMSFYIIFVQLLMNNKMKMKNPILCGLKEIYIVLIISRLR